MKTWGIKFETKTILGIEKDGRKTLLECTLQAPMCVVKSLCSNSTCSFLDGLHIVHDCDESGMASSFWWYNMCRRISDNEAIVVFYFFSPLFPPHSCYFAKI